MDIQGANIFKEHLQSSDRFPSRPSQINLLSDLKSTLKVESILVCTGVYNPQNDLLYHLNHLFNNSARSDSQDSSDLNNNKYGSSDNVSTSDFYISSSSSEMNLTTRNRPDSVPNLMNLEQHELKNAMSRHNSFISYFDNKYNLPDLTVDNLQDAVQHIINKEILSQF